MMRLEAATTAACLTLLWTAPAGGQSPAWGGGASALNLSAGVVQNGRRDLTASPLTFAGWGADVSAGYARAIGPIWLEALAHGGIRRLEASGDDPQSRERLTEGHLLITTLRRLDARPAGTPGLAVGLALDGGGSVTAHGYGNLMRPSSNFVLASASLGPAASWKQPVAGGTATFSLNVPVIAVVAHSYSEVNQPTFGTSLRLVLPGKWRAVGGTVAYTPAEDRPIGLIYRYRFGLLRYDDVQPVRTVSQSLSAGVVARFGARR